MPLWVFNLQEVHIFFLLFVFRVLCNIDLWPSAWYLEFTCNIDFQFSDKIKSSHFDFKTLNSQTWLYSSLQRLRSLYFLLSHGNSLDIARHLDKGALFKMAGAWNTGNTGQCNAFYVLSHLLIFELGDRSLPCRRHKFRHINTAEQFLNGSLHFLLLPIFPFIFTKVST